MISAIVAVDKDWGIGYQGQLLEHLSPDMKYFKELTMGNIVIMGRKTWDSLPQHPLPNRINFVITHNNHQSSEMTAFISMDEALQRLKDAYEEDEWFVIGGGSIYEQLLPLCDRVYLTMIGKAHKDVDTYFPNLDKDPNWEIDTCTDLRDYNGIPYAFLTYERV